MKLTIEIERTFALKQFENVKPCVKMEFDAPNGMSPEEVRQHLDSVTEVIEEYGKDFQQKAFKTEGQTS